MASFKLFCQDAFITGSVSSTDQMALEIGNEIIHKADKAAISNIISSAQLDLNKGGTSDHLQAALEQSLEVGNMAFMGFPVIHGSFDTVARKIDEIAESTGIDGMLFSWADFVTGVRDFGQYVMPQLKCLQ